MVASVGLGSRHAADRRACFLRGRPRTGHEAQGAIGFNPAGPLVARRFQMGADTPCELVSGADLSKRRFRSLEPVKLVSRPEGRVASYPSSPGVPV